MALTGASRGIGRATAVALAGRGVGLALLGRASAHFELLACELRELGAQVEVIDVDLDDLPSVERAGKRLVEVCDAPIALINNAGTIERLSVEQTPVEAWERQIHVNLTAPFLLTRSVLPAMRRASRGHIIHVGSIASTLGTARSSAYCASKWGLVGFMKALAQELSGSGLMTAAILPGSVDTDMLVGSGFMPDISPTDVATTIVHFALDAPTSHNGAIIEMFGT